MMAHSPMWVQNRARKSQLDKETSPREALEVLRDSSEKRLQWMFVQSILSLIFDPICCRQFSFRWCVTVCPLASWWPSSAYSGDDEYWAPQWAATAFTVFFFLLSPCMWSSAAYTLKSNLGASGRTKQLSHSGQTECVFLSITHYSDIALTDLSAVRFDP